MEQTREAAKDFFNNILRHLIDEAPRRSQELCVRRVVRNKQLTAAISRRIYHLRTHKIVLSMFLIALQSNIPDANIAAIVFLSS